MKRINLLKYGFTRWEHGDFTDDGSKFYCYKAGDRVIVSKCTYNGQVYLSGRIDGDYLDYNVYSTLPHFKALDRLNGVLIDGLIEEDLIQFYNDCLEYEKEYKEAEKNVVFPTIEELKEQCLKIRAHYQEQLIKAKNYIEQNALTLFLKADGFTIRRIRTNLEVISNRAKGYDPNTYPQTIQKSCYGINFAKPTNPNLSEEWYYNEIIELIDTVK